MVQPIGFNLAMTNDTLRLRNVSKGVIVTTQNQYWVSPHDKGWSLKRASKIYTTKAEALAAGRAQAIKNGAELVGQKRNGQINLKNSYGNDPIPPRDKQ